MESARNYSNNELFFMVEVIERKLLAFFQFVLKFVDLQRSLETGKDYFEKIPDF